MREREWILGLLFLLVLVLILGLLFQRVQQPIHALNDTSGSSNRRRLNQNGAVRQGRIDFEIFSNTINFHAAMNILQKRAHGKCQEMSGKACERALPLLGSLFLHEEYDKTYLLVRQNQDSSVRVELRIRSHGFYLLSDLRQTVCVGSVH